MIPFKLNDFVFNKNSERGNITDVIVDEEYGNRYFVEFPKQFGWYDEAELRPSDISEEDLEEYTRSSRIYPRELDSAPSNDLYIPIPTYKDFLPIWRQFKDMAKKEGFDQDLLEHEDNLGLDWDKYFYDHQYLQSGQTLLEYCINRSFPDIHCTSHSEVTRFGMSAFQLEPEMDFHNEEAGIIRRATEVEVLHFSGVRHLEDLEEELTEMLSTGGFLKIMVACPEGDIEAWEYKHLLKKEISSWYEVNEEEEDVEYILLIPKIEGANILWEYLVLNYKGEELKDGIIA